MFKRAFIREYSSINQQIKYIRKTEKKTVGGESQGDAL